MTLYSENICLSDDSIYSSVQVSKVVLSNPLERMLSTIRNHVSNSKNERTFAKFL